VLTQLSEGADPGETTRTSLLERPGAHHHTSKHGSADIQARDSLSMRDSISIPGPSANVRQPANSLGRAENRNSGRGVSPPRTGSRTSGTRRTLTRGVSTEQMRALLFASTLKFISVCMSVSRGYVQRIQGWGRTAQLQSCSVSHSSSRSYMNTCSRVRSGSYA
jgi:hypothetical protein